MRIYLVPRAGSVAMCAAAIVMCAITAALTASGSTSDQVWLEAFARSLTVAAPIGVGLFALHRPPFERFGTLLIVAGSVWFLTTLANAESGVAYSTGRIAAWAFEPLLMYCMLAFPTGRLDNRLDRVLVSITALVALLLFLPTALLVEHYPTPAHVMGCVASCPANAFMVSGSEPAFVEDVVRPLRETLVVALFSAVALRLALRIRSSTPLVRLTVTPVLAVACFRCAAYAGAFVGRWLAPESAVLDVSLWLLALTVPLMALAFLAGLVRWWVFMALATQRLAAKLREHPTPEDLRRGLAEAFDDPALEVVYWLNHGKGQWGDADGHTVSPPSAAEGRAVTEILDQGRRVAALVHDAALKDDHAFIDTATSYAVMTIENHRLSAQTSSLLREVRESRSRIQAAADDERRRIERDLHDGAQQRLVALRIKLELAAEQTGGGNGNGNGAAGAAALRRLGDDVEDALEEVRSLARGIYPASLDRGLVEGLRAAALRNALPTTVLAAGIQRHSRGIESAAYFVCLEALQNASKHADGASVVVIELSEGDALRMEVRDDGAGFDPAAVVGGLGFTSMRDRLAAVSGDLAIISSPGHGTRVVATIPIPEAPAGSHAGLAACCATVWCQHDQRTHARPVGSVAASGDPEPMRQTPDPRDVALGLAAGGARLGFAAGRVALLPARLAVRGPVGVPVRRAARDLAHQGSLVRERALVRLEMTADGVLASPELGRAADRLLAGPLTDAVARSLATHRVVERVAVQILATADLDRVIGAVLDHEMTERAVDRALASPGLERLVIRVLESRLVDEVTDQVLRSPEMERVVEHIATSPQVIDAVTKHTQTLAEEMVADVRRRTHTVDDIAEQTVRGWLRRPRPA